MNFSVVIWTRLLCMGAFWLEEFGWEPERVPFWQFFGLEGPQGSFLKTSNWGEFRHTRVAIFFSGRSGFLLKLNFDLNKEIKIFNCIYNHLLETWQYIWHGHWVWASFDRQTCTSFKFFFVNSFLFFLEFRKLLHKMRNLTNKVLTFLQKKMKLRFEGHSLVKKTFPSMNPNSPSSIDVITPHSSSTSDIIHF